MTKILAFLRKEFLEMLPPTLFFLALFHIVILSRRLSGAEGDFEIATSAAALVAALTLGKAILVADALPLFRLFREGAMIWNVLWRALLYLAIALVFQLAEEATPLLRSEGGLAPALAALGAEIHWPRFWATHLILAVLLTGYAFVTALIDVIGRERFRTVFFGRGRGPRGGAVAPG